MIGKKAAKRAARLAAALAREARPRPATPTPARAQLDAAPLAPAREQLDAVLLAPPLPAREQLVEVRQAEPLVILTNYDEAHRARARRVGRGLLLSLLLGFGCAPAPELLRDKVLGLSQLATAAELRHVGRCGLAQPGEVFPPSTTGGEPPPRPAPSPCPALLSCMHGVQEAAHACQDAVHAAAGDQPDGVYRGAAALCLSGDRVARTRCAAAGVR